MRNILIAAVAATVLSAGSASAADIAARPYVKAPAPVPYYSWTGFYVGVNGGGAFGSTGASHTGLPVGSLGASNDYGLGHDLSGGFGGGQIGYNWQFDPKWVVGIEADVQGADIRGSSTIVGAIVTTRGGGAGAPGNFVTSSEKVDAFGTIRARFGGLITPETLIYATGGAAWGNVKYSGQFHYATPEDYIGSDSSTRRDTRWALASNGSLLRTGR